MRLAQALTTVVASMVHSWYDPVIFDRPGEVFHGLGFPCFFPALDIEEKRILIGAIIRRKF